MKAFSNILMCTDFSDCANHALSYAVHFAACTRANLYMLHVTDSELAESSEIMRDRINNIDAAFFTGSEVDYHWLIKQGEIEETIDAIAKKKDIDLIVVGIKGYLGERELLRGSITAHLMERRIPALLGIPGRTNSGYFKRIGIAVNKFRSITKESFKTIRNMAVSCDARVSMIHVQTSGDEVPEQFEYKFEEFFGDYFDGYQEVKGSDVLTVTEDFVIKNKLDLLVLFHSCATDQAHHRSITKQWVFKSSIPLLVLPRH